MPTTVFFCSPISSSLIFITILLISSERIGLSIATSFSLSLLLFCSFWFSSCSHISTGSSSEKEELKVRTIIKITNNVNLQVEFSSNGGSSYGIEKTTTFVYVYNNNANNSSSFTYQTARDLVNSTGGQQIASLQGNGASECSSGTLRLFNPASTTYVKNFYVVANSYDNSGPYYIYNIPAGYVNTTSALNAIQFTMSSGNIDAGTFKLYGVK